MKNYLIALVAILTICGYALPITTSKADAIAVTPEVLTAGAKTMTLRITAYASVPEETDDTPFITANGTYVRDGIAASNLLPFGTEIMIPELFGNKIFIIEDRMAPEFKRSIDIWMPSVDKAIFFGMHTATVVIVPPGPILASAVRTSQSTPLNAKAQLN